MRPEPRRPAPLGRRSRGVSLVLRGQVRGARVAHPRRSALRRGQWHRIRGAKRLLVAVLTFGAMLLVPAIPAQAVLPAGCTVYAGKIVVATSTANRAVDIRYPGISYTAVHYVIAAHVSLYSWNGTSWVTVARVAYSQAVWGVSSMPGASFHVSCPHNTRVEAAITYGARDSSTGMSVAGAVLDQYSQLLLGIR